MSDVLSRALSEIAPGGNWRLSPSGELEWLSSEIPRPQDTVIEAKCAEIIQADQEARVDQERHRLFAEVDAIHASALKTLTGGATIEERDTWAPKAFAARALLAGTADNSQAVMLALEAQQRGITPEELAQSILERAADFERLIGLASAIRVKARAAIKGAQTLGDLLRLEKIVHSEAEATIAQILAVEAGHA